MTSAYENARDFDAAAGEQEVQSKMWESPTRCRRLGRSVFELSKRDYTLTDVAKNITSRVALSNYILSALVDAYKL